MSETALHHKTSTVSSSALSVNLNKVALLRNARDLDLPSVTQAARLCLQAGAHGLTVHPRPDARHIRPQDVELLSALLKDWPDREFNIEGNPFHNLMDLVERFRPHQATLVPDGMSQSTSDHGWQLPSEMEALRPKVAQLKAWGVRVSLFMDPIPEMMVHCKALGVERIELYTERFARAYALELQEPNSVRMASAIAPYIETAKAAQALGLEVNAGHDLNALNLKYFVSHVPLVKEVSIGHAFIADALELGYERAVQVYLEQLQGSQAS
jgi:pyridoxine 5-phosphate synthase